MLSNRIRRSLVFRNGVCCVLIVALSFDAVRQTAMTRVERDAALALTLHDSAI
jgi:hypothetical protein